MTELQGWILILVTLANVASSSGRLFYARRAHARETEAQALAQHRRRF